MPHLGFIVGARVSYQDDGQTFTGTILSVDRPAASRLMADTASVRWDTDSVSRMPLAELHLDATSADRQSTAIAGYKRGLNYWLERMGVPRVDRLIPPASEPTDRKVKMQVWLRDSLLWSLEELELGRPLYAFRGLLQAAGYAGEVGHDSTSSDVFLFLRNEIESVIGNR